MYFFLPRLALLRHVLSAAVCHAMFISGLASSVTPMLVVLATYQERAK